MKWESLEDQLILVPKPFRTYMGRGSNEIFNEMVRSALSITKVCLLHIGLHNTLPHIKRTKYNHENNHKLCLN